MNFGWRLAQAANAFWYDALFVLSVVDVVELVEPEDPLGNVTPWSFRQLRYAAEVALEKPPGLVPYPLGRRLAQAASAFWYDALVVLSVVDVVELVEPEDPLGNVTPWSFRQLRYAAEAALEKPPGPVPNPFGRRLAQAADAFWNAGELKLPPLGKLPPVGKLPLVGKLPPVAPVPNPLSFTPCFCIHAAYAVTDALELLLALVAALVEEVVEELALDDPPPHALNATDPTSAMASKGNETRRTDRTRSAGPE